MQTQAQANETKRERNPVQKDVIINKLNKVMTTVDKIAPWPHHSTPKVLIIEIALAGLFDTGTQISIMSPETAEFLHLSVY